MPSTWEIAESIRSELKALEMEAGRLKEALSALSERSVAPRRAGTPSTQPRTSEPSPVIASSPTRSSATSESIVRDDDVIQAVADGANSATSIASQFGVPVAQVRARLAELEAAGAITRSGHGRGTQRTVNHAA